MIKKILRALLKLRLSPEIAIDLGTANTLVYLKGKGIVLREPSIISVRKNAKGENIPIAVGSSAKEMAGKTPDFIQVIKPMRDGVISDFELSRTMIEYFTKKALNSKWLPYYPRIVMCVPYGATPVEKRIIKESIVGEVFLLYEPLAAAIGAGLKIESPSGNMIVDIGGGTTEIAVISLGGIVYAKSIRIAGDSIDVAISMCVKDHYDIIIGNNQAEQIKIKIGTLDENDEEIFLDVYGKNSISGLPQCSKISSKVIGKAIESQWINLVYYIREVLENISSELASDIYTNGINICGGGAIMKGIKPFLQNNIKLPVFVVENPLDCVVNGAGMSLGNRNIEYI